MESSPTTTAPSLPNQAIETKKVLQRSSYALPPLDTLTLDDLQKIWCKTTHAPVPKSLDEFSIGHDSRILREDEQEWPQRILMFSGEPTAYAEWLTKRVVTSLHQNSTSSWNIVDIVNGLVYYETRTAVMIIREILGVDSSAMKHIIKKLSWNNQWHKYACLLKEGGVFSEDDIARLEVESDLVDTELAKKRENSAIEISNIMTSTLVATFFVAPSSLLYETLLKMQDSGISVKDAIHRFIQDHPYYAHTPPRALRGLIGDKEFLG